MVVWFGGTEMNNHMKRILVISILLAFLYPLMVVSSSDSFNYDEVTNIVTLYPTGVDDTENLLLAFETVIEGGPGGTVQLVEGEYTISDEIVVVNFDGYFKGAGMYKTVIKNAYTEEWPHRTEEFFPEVAGLILFYQTDELVHEYSITDMKIVVQGKTTEYDQFFGINIIEIVGRVNGDKSDLYETELNTHLENVYFKGDVLDVWHYTNVINPYQIGGEFIIEEGWFFKPITGTHVIRNCIFDTACGPKFNCINGDLLIENIIMNNSAICATIYDPLNIADESNVIIRNNTVSNTLLRGYWLWGAENILFENNVIENSMGDGLFLFHSDNNHINNNKIINCTNGLTLDSSNNN